MNQLAPVPSLSAPIPALVAAAEENKCCRLLDFFAANIRNRHTRRSNNQMAARGDQAFV